MARTKLHIQCLEDRLTPAGIDDFYIVEKNTTLAVAPTWSYGLGTSANIQSDAGETIGGGKTFLFDSSSSIAASSSVSGGRQTLTILVTNPQTRASFLGFVSIQGTFQAGTTYTVTDATSPTMVWSSGSKSNASNRGTFTINEMELDDSQSLVRLSLDFDQTSASTPNLHLRGQVRINTGVPFTTPHDLALNDITILGGSVTTTLDSAPSHGNLILNPNGTFSYTPTTDYTGPDSFRYTARTTDGFSAPAVVNLNVQVVLHPPTIVSPIPDSIVARGSVGATVDISSHFTDREDGSSGLVYSISGNSNPGLFSAISLSNGQLNALFTNGNPGSSNITITATDKDGMTVSDTFVLGINHPPTATGSSSIYVNLTQTQVATPTVVDLTTLFSDVEQGSSGLLYSFISNSNSALVSSATVVGSSLTLSYAPGNQGTASIVVRATDAFGEILNRTLDVHVNRVPSFVLTSSEARVVVSSRSNPQTFANFAAGIAGGFANTPFANLQFTLTPLGTTGNLAFTTAPAIDASTGSLTFDVAAFTTGRATYRAALIDTTASSAGGGNSSSTLDFTIVVIPAIDQSSSTQFSVDYAGGVVKVFTTAGPTGVSFQPTQSAGSIARSLIADVNGDGIADIISVTTPGRPTALTIYDGASGIETRRTTLFEDSFTGGAFVASADLTADGKADYAVSADDSGGARIIVYGSNGQQLANFFGIEDPNFRGGARVSFGDLNGDGVPDLLVAAGTGGGPRVAVFDGRTLQPGRTPSRLFGDFFAFEPSLRDGAYVASGDFDGDGRADLVVAGGPTGGPRVTIYNGAILESSGGIRLRPLANFFAGDPNIRSGIRIAVKNLDNDVYSDLVVSVETPRGPAVFGFTGTNLAGPTRQKSPVASFGPDQIGALLGGTYVG